MRATQPKNMLAPREAAKWLPLAQTLAAFVLLSVILSTHAQSPSLEPNGVEVMIVQGTVEVARAGQTVRDLASTQLPYRRLNPGDRVWTRDHSRATVRLSDLTIVELGPNSTIVRSDNR